MQTQDIPVYSHPSHLPCPDLMSNPLTEAQKETGLKGVQSARQHLMEIQLKPLREKTAELKERGKATDNLSEQKTITNEIARIQREAQRIQERWG
ncbi:hypothetical protein [Vibrio sp. HN007]|uniref:hypothetical protein n=1 Tax=Vibrio iocasae TaxID=3098914 RepID=UPI0035D4AEF4